VLRSKRLHFKAHLYGKIAFKIYLRRVVSRSSRTRFKHHSRAEYLPLLYLVARSRHRRKGYRFAFFDIYGARLRFGYAVRLCFKRAVPAFHTEIYGVLRKRRAVAFKAHLNFGRLGYSK